MELWEKAIDLEQFIGNFIPKGFREPIKVFDFTPTISEQNYIYFDLCFNKGTLENDLKTYSDLQIIHPICRFNKPYIISAITEYFKNKNRSV
ncbi:MAG: hypothetical protein WC554_17310 [Clostridia bacterium]|jgi:hypothetical protein